MSRENLIFITSYAGNFNGRDYNERSSIYGSELACINVAIQLTRWYSVTVFVNDDVDLVADNVRYVRWSDYNTFCHENKIDICIVSRYINFFIYNRNYAEKTYLWLHDTDVHSAFNGLALPDKAIPLLFNLLPTIEKLVCVGKTQMNELFIARHSIPQEKICYIPNGIVASSTQSVENLLRKKRPNSFVFCSSPDRHLSIALKLFPKITKLLRNATLDIYYADLPDDCKLLAADQPNVKCHGRVPQATLLKELESIEYWFYPTKFFETCCTTAFETAYQGCIQITSYIGALKENVKGITIDHDPESKEFETKLLKILDNITPSMKRNIVQRQYSWAKEQTWENRGLTWHQLFETGSAKYIVANSIYQHKSIGVYPLPYYSRYLNNPLSYNCEWYDALKGFLEATDTNEYISLDIVDPEIKPIKCCFVTELEPNTPKKFDVSLVKNAGVILNRKGAEMLWETVVKTRSIDISTIYNTFGSSARMIINGETVPRKDVRSHRFTVACAVMVKNEEKTIEKSLRSVAKFVNSIIIYDTGSSDKTIDICKKWCEENKIQIYIKQDTRFIDFATSRNIMLRFADDKADYLLLLDAADELQNAAEIYNIIARQPEKYIFRVTQVWALHGAEQRYDNFRLIKTGKNILYDYPVHEVLSGIYMNDKYIGDLRAVTIYQDRAVDVHKSKIRWTRDKEILLKERIKRPTDCRVVFYLAQTYKCLKMFDLAVATYKQRIELGGYADEVQQAYIDIYEMLAAVGKRAEMYEILQEFWDKHKRGEAAYYMSYELLSDETKETDQDKKDQLIASAYEWALKARDSPKPTTHLWVNHNVFDHKRHQTLALAAYYSTYDEIYQIGFQALKRALQYDAGNPVNKMLVGEYSKLGYRF
jgi:glycosyltransferase involved in cell wall biosynthesis